MTPPFQGLHVAVTGGTGALGSAVVRALLDAGASVHVPVFHLRELERFPFHEDRRVRVAPGIDLCAEPSAEAFYREIPSLYASIHVAGGFAMGPLEQTTAAQLDDLYAMNVKATFLASREAVKRIRAGSPRRATAGGSPTIPLGSIVNIGARPGAHPTLGAGMAGYAASKAAVTALTQALAEELRAEGIWVNAVLPSIMDTPANRRAMPDANHALWPKVEEVAAAILNLASPANALTTGALVPVFGRA